MWTLFDLVGHWGLLTGVVCAAGAVLSLVYVPAPAKHYAVAACLIALGASQIYSAGYHSADVEWQGKYDRAIAAINDANEKAVIAAQVSEREKASAQQAVIVDQVNQLADQNSKDQDELDALRATIASDKTAPDKLDPGLRRIIRGDLK